MSLPKISIKHAVFAFMLSFIFVVFGIISYQYIAVQASPNVDFPAITVTTNFPGADPQLINNTLTKPIESALNTIPGVQHITSSSEQNRSSVQLTFVLGTSMDAAFNEVQSKLNHIKDELPSEAKSPVITKIAAGADPVMLIAVYGQRTLAQLDTLVRTQIKPKLENLPGVGEVQIEGVTKPQVNVNLNLTKMAAMGITPANVQSAFNQQHVRTPGGYVVASKQQYTLELDLEFHSLAAMKKMIVAYRQDAPVRLEDIATLEQSVGEQQQFALYQGEPTIGISIVKKNNANTVTLVKQIQQRLTEQVKPMLPPGVQYKVVFEQASYILDIIHNLERDVWLSILAAGLVIFFFLRNVRSTFIVVAAIPVSLLGVLAMIYFGNYTLNVVTLLGIILLVGVVVDDAIVMLENIHRHGSEHRLTPLQAANQGSDQVVFAVLASSLSLVCIFVPVIFMGGIIGLFFRSFAVVVTTGVLISLLVSLTLTPMLCSRFLRFDAKENRISIGLEHAFVKLENGYKWLLSHLLKARWLVLSATLMMVLACLPLLFAVHKGFMPEQGNTGNFRLSLQTPQGSDAEYMNAKLKTIDQILASNKNVANYFTSVGPANQATITVTLLPTTQLSAPQSQIARALQAQLDTVPGLKAFVNASGSGGTTVNFAVMGQDYGKTLNAAFNLFSKLQQHPTLGQVYVIYTPPQPAYRLSVDRSLAASLGVSPQQVNSTLAILGGGTRIAKFNADTGDQRLDVVLRSAKGEFTQPEDLSLMYLTDNKQNLLSLDTIAALEMSLVPAKISRQDLNYSVEIVTNPKLSLGEAVDLIQQVAAKTLPAGITLQMTGDAASLGSTMHIVLFTFGLIILLIYAVLASQFNSFIQPLIILLAQPLAIIGGLLVLWLTGQTLNIYSMVGMLLLMGLVAKNSILLVDLTNKLRDEGRSIHSALLEACPIRMRPVLMTSLAIIFAMLPAAFGSHTAGGADQALSLVIIGGMISSTMLTLLVVPAAYSLVSKVSAKA